MDNKKIVVGILLVVSILTFALVYKSININNLAADSGFDTSWDSGGSDWGGSDWGGSSYDSDWGSSSWSSSNRNYNSSSNYSFGREEIVVYFFIMFVICTILILFYIHSNKKPKRVTRTNIKDNILKENKEALENILKEIPNFNKEEFYDYVFKNFVDVQNAWMNFDYEALRKLVTDELYNTYKSQLITLEKKKQKNIMSDFDRSDIAIIKYYKSGNKHNIVLKMTARFYDYLVDENNKVIRGSDKRRIIITYALTYVSSIEEKQNKCPNCNAPLDNSSSSNVCAYCKSTIVSSSHNFILSKKESFEQRME